jgi:hypothetical protein
MVANEFQRILSRLYCGPFVGIPGIRVEEQSIRFIVRDDNGRQLAYVYFEDEPGWRSAAREYRHAWKNCARLLSATAIERMAVVSGVTVVPNARIAGVALTGMHGYKALAAMGKTLELDGGNRILRKQED